MELYRAKNVATIIVFPLVDADGDPVTSASSPDSEIDAWADGAAPDGFTDCTNEATEIGSTGMYSLSLTQAEMNQDYIIIQVKSGNAKTQVILINTKPITANTTQIAGAAVSTSSAQIGVNVVSHTAGAITAAAIATGAIDADALAADAVDEIWDEVMEGTTTARQMQRGFASALLSELSGAATTTVVCRDIGDTKDRITATVDADGNRSAITLDLT